MAEAHFRRGTPLARQLPVLVMQGQRSSLMDAVLAEEAGMLTTRRLGSAVHLGQSDVQRVPPRDVAKLYVDWLLMRRAAHAYRLGRSTLMLSARVAAGDPENITTFS